MNAKSSRRIIAIVGMPGSGKSILSTYFKNKGYPVIRFGDVIIDELKKRSLVLTPRNEQIVREDIRSRFGMDACVKLTLPAIKKELEEHGVVIVDGLYSFSEYKTLISEFGDQIVVLAVFAPKKLRYQRLALRADRPLQPAEAQERDLSETEKIEKGGPIALADYTLLNDSTIDDLIKRTETLLPMILNEEPKL